MVLKKLGRLSKSTFVRSVIAVSSGQSIATLVPILAVPILGRLYTPEDNGLLGVYMSAATVFGAIATFSYSQALLIERSDNKASTLVYACIAMVAIVSLAACVVGVGMCAIADRLNAGSTRWWFLLLPVSTFMGGYSVCQAAVANRLSVYKRIAITLAIPSVLGVVVSVVLGSLGFGVNGLFTAYFIVQLGTVLLYHFLVPKLKTRSNAASIKRIFAMLRRHRKFAFYTTPTSFISSFTMNAPVYAMTALQATSTIGLYSRANQLLNLPSVVLGNSIAQVFQRKAAVQFAETGSCREVYRKTLVSLVVVGALPTILLGLFAPSIFTWILGPKWTEAGGIARILAPTMLLRIVCSPLSTVFYIAEKQTEDLFLSIVTSLATIGLVCAAMAYPATGVGVVFAHTIGFALTYIVYIVRSSKHCVAVS